MGILPLDGLYTVHQTLGTGGFAKVKLATHDLTGEKVAIKIMDKSALGDDLPRVKVEIEALKELSHPNICKLYQVIETETHYYLVLEYCPGGELFDYIVEREHVTEREGRVFFRQIIAAVAYIHERGYAHRDLKPENLLLDNDQNLKLIDFGLCAKPKCGMQEPLETCCGSPAYAAPELIFGDNYNGTKVDIWSMGVLLYALLVGQLPFEDENLPKLYKKIQRGRYLCPSWLSLGSKSMLSHMLQVDPAHRASIEDLKHHPWITKGCDVITMWHSQKRVDEYDIEILAELAVYYKKSMRSIEVLLNKKNFDYMYSTYHLLVHKKASGRKFSLVPQKMVLQESTQYNNNSLSIFDTSPVIKRASMDCLANSDLLILGSPPELSPKAPRKKSASKDSSRSVKDKENFTLPSLPSAKKSKRSIFKLYSCDNAALTPKPKASGVCASSDTAVHSVGGGSNSSIPYTQLECKRAKSYDSPISNATVTPKRPSARANMGSAKKVFGSIEKGIDCVKNIFTPKKREGTLSKPRQIKKLCNVSAINDHVTAEEVLDSLRGALLRRGVFCKQKGFTLRGKISDGKQTCLRFELEVCQLPNHQSAVGIRRKRLHGDAWLYKRVCEEVLKLALLDDTVATTDV